MRGHHRRWRHGRHGHRRRHPRRGIAGYLRGRLRRRLFVWFGVVIVLSGAVAVTVAWATSTAPGWREEVVRLRAFTGQRFAETWQDPPRRDALAEAISVELEANVTLADASGQSIANFGGPCDDRHFTADVIREGAVLGEVSICPRRNHKPQGFAFLFALLGAGAVLWTAAGFLARRLTRPLDEIVHVARDIGDGRLDSRMELGRHHTGELEELAETFNDMAARIQKQLTDQKELLAAVSHEIRTPLGHLRILLDLARDKDFDPEMVDEIEKEVLEVDSLVDQLLASSRLEFETLDMRPLDAADLARRALTRLSLDDGVLEVTGDDLALRGDPTLLGRALANLLDNAMDHGGGVRRLEVVATEGQISFAVEDAGPGIAPEERDRIFDSFYRGDRKAGASHGSLGLGLSLVQRIAIAHGGQPFAGDSKDGGARVGITLPREDTTA
ncbi:MAG: HAMP domain-containing histidine kinase [Deltaproteobacteria bacterium]|nr:HAMP domain-containing histidine kinase [Deltaproteobacteria bacterium]